MDAVIESVLKIARKVAVTAAKEAGALARDILRRINRLRKKAKTATS